MKKIVKWLAVASLVCGLNGGDNLTSLDSVALQSREEIVTVSTLTDALQIRAKSAYLIDYGTQSVLYSKNEEAHLPIASMCKIMTLILSFEAIKQGDISFDDEICISERAASMGGSQVFLEANGHYLIRELIKSIVVCSANDSCVAMAEKIAGSESLFVDRMNEKAKELGANNTLFSNCTGLPKEPQYSCAKDVSIMLKELLTNKEYYEFGKVWLDKFEHPQGRYTEITNTNKLIRFYDGCDGGKTGFTNEAGFCLAATAKRKDMRIVAVVIGEETSANRFEDVTSMFDYAFSNYMTAPIVEANIPLAESITVSGGKQKLIRVCPEKSAYAFSKKGEKANYTTEIVVEKLYAPLSIGDRVGELIVFKDGTEIERIPLITLDEVKKASFLDRLKEIAGAWNG